MNRPHAGARPTIYLSFCGDLWFENRNDVAPDTINTTLGLSGATFKCETQDSPLQMPTIWVDGDKPVWRY